MTISQRQLRPNSSCEKSEEYFEKSRKFIEQSRKIRENSAKELRVSREELYNDVWFDRHYWIPLDKYDEFITNPSFDIEYYSFENYTKRSNRKREISNFGYDLYNHYIENFMCNTGGLYYKQIVFLDNYTNLRIINNVLDKMKDQFGEESYDPFSEDDYAYGVENFNLIDEELINEYDYEVYPDDEYYIEDEA